MENQIQIPNSLSHKLDAALLKDFTLGRGVQFVGLKNLSSQAFIIASLFSKLPSPFSAIIVAPNQDVYQELGEYLKWFIPPSHSILHLPQAEHSPYLNYNGSTELQAERFYAISRFLTHPQSILLTSVGGLAYKIPPLSHFASDSLTLQLTQTIELPSLVNELEKLGYHYVEQVEGIGTYANRGGIIDVFPNGNPSPYRIEFFDDEIESIRTFDPETQLSDPISTENPILEIQILPLSEYQFTEEEIKTAKTNIKKFCDENHIPKQKRDLLFEQLNMPSGLISGIEVLLPFFINQNSLGSLLGILEKKENPYLFFTDSFECEKELESIKIALQEDYKESISQKKIVSAPSEVILGQDEIKSRLKNINSFFINSIKTHYGSHGFFQSEEIKTLEINSFPIHWVGSDGKHHFKEAAQKIKDFIEENYQILIACNTKSQEERINYLFKENNINTPNLRVEIAQIKTGFHIPESELLLITDQDLFGEKKKIKAKKSSKKVFFENIQTLEIGDYIVHTQHGIGIYRGLVKLAHNGIPSGDDYFLIEYDGEDKLYLPVYKMGEVQKYTGSDGKAKLNKLGSGQFEKSKTKAKNAIKKLAIDLIEMQAKRQLKPGYAFGVHAQEFMEFESNFPYTETPDQLDAIRDVVKDMENPTPMDRLICGDVGFGKTEVAMRAAYKAVLDGKQVAVLVPTTILCQQHLESFRERFKTTPVSIESVSRLKKPLEIKETIEKLKSGKIDILIGTHRILSKDIQWSDLGLIIIDEEQRFGVEHKEKLKILREAIDTLTLTATPIPRTLHFALSGIRDMSIIQTPPVDRQSIKTYLVQEDPIILQRAVQSELKRGGQVFFVHNRVQSIEKKAAELRALLPEARVLVAHGQLTPKELEGRMFKFYTKEFNILISTTIIESGIDIPSANTMFINKAHHFGLSQLYQLRGRIGRSKERAYCYLIAPDPTLLTPEARSRLSVLQSFVDLGSGFQIASHDLELRGAGDLVGAQQSGHVAAIGLDLYLELLEDAVKELRGQGPIEEEIQPEIKIQIPCYIPEAYIPAIGQRLSLYKRMSQASDYKVLEDIELELTDRFGQIPEVCQNLLWLMRLKALLKKYRISSFIAGPTRFSLSFDPEHPKSTKLIDRLLDVAKNNAQLVIKPEGKFLIPSNLLQDPQNMGKIFLGIQRLIEE